MDIMTVLKEKAVDIISHMSKDKVYYVLQHLDWIANLSQIYGSACNRDMFSWLAANEMVFGKVKEERILILKIYN